MLFCQLLRDAALRQPTLIALLTELSQSRSTEPEMLKGHPSITPLQAYNNLHWCLLHFLQDTGPIQRWESRAGVGGLINNSQNSPVSMACYGIRGPIGPPSNFSSLWPYTRFTRTVCERCMLTLIDILENVQYIPRPAVSGYGFCSLHHSKLPVKAMLNIHQD